MVARFILAVSLLMVLVTVATLTAGTVQAVEPETGEPMTAFVADGAGLSQHDEGIAIAGSVVALLAALEPDRPIAFIDAERPAEVFGPIAPSSAEYRGLASGINSELASSSGGEGDLFSAVAESATLFGLERAGAGSTVYLLLGSGAGDAGDSLPGRLAPLVRRLSDQGFSMQVIAIGGAGGETTALADRIAQVAGQPVINASSPEAMRDMVRRLANGSGYGLDMLGDFDRPSGQVVNVPIDVAPGTVELSLVALRDERSGLVRLLDPSGAEAGQSSSAPLTSPYIAAWNITDPASGRWQLEAAGPGGPVTLWGAQANAIELVLDIQGPVPVGEPIELVASAAPESALGSATEVFAHVKAPDGTSITYQLRDDGVAPDVAAADRHFSGTILPLAESGDHEVVLELAWEGAAFSVKSQHILRSQPFPSLSVEGTDEGDLVAGERVRVAVATVAVDGRPYAVSPAAISWELSGVTDAGAVEVVPRDPSSSGESWAFDVFATLNEPVHSAMTLSLSLEYAGRAHVDTADFIVLSLPSPVQTAPSQPAAVEAPTAPPAADESGFPWWTLAFPAAFLAALALLGARWMSASAPVGYLYDDNRKRLVDFSTLRRGVGARMFSKSRISGKELGIPGLDTVSFVFDKGTVSLRADRPSFNIRIGGKPLFGETSLGSQTWIGTDGRAYSFRSASATAGS